MRRVTCLSLNVLINIPLHSVAIAVVGRIHLFGWVISAAKFGDILMIREILPKNIFEGFTCKSNLLLP